MTDDEKAYHRKTAKDRKTQIVDAGLELAEQDGLKNVRRQELAEFVGIARSLITHHFGDMNGLLEEIVRAAIDQNKLKVIGEAILLGYLITADLSADMRKAAINALAES